MASGRIKGTAIAQTVADVQRLVAEGRLAEAELEEQLEKTDLELLAGEIQPGLWYDNGAHARMTALLCRVEGHGRDAYVVQRGADTADRLLAMGLYQQLRLAEDDAEVDDPVALHRSLRLLVSLSGAMYDFGRWEVRPVDGAQPRLLRIEVHEAEALTEMNRLTAEGFIRRIATRLLSRPPRVTSRRDAPDRVAYEIELGPRG